eukprot:CAMPEP_0197235472 /NCGR_PEP_ID=MMETSP1429-20130617/2887_1 /TAXON_ID=49237 /ORGANISM="Chaetoceros  sp., Strain UNC1202" /LENGTH=41 /DNA_ID= /DNA_START= /DNA_END= /DNA_ORIENTATION=
MTIVTLAIAIIAFLSTSALVAKTGTKEWLSITVGILSLVSG